MEELANAPAVYDWALAAMECEAEADKAKASFEGNRKDVTPK